MKTRLAIMVCLVSLSSVCLAQGRGVESTVHNLSVTGPGDVRSMEETEVCKFCHVPHTPVAKQPLWGHALSKVTQYKTPKMRRGSREDTAPQPNGSSRLCLSCHDGTVALGDMGPNRREIAMGGNARLTAGRPGFIGTDLSGSHPISIDVMDDAVESPGSDMGLRSRSIIEGDGDVRLDAEGRIQCTSCHDPHSDPYYQEGKVPHFYVKRTVTEACLVCHELR